MVSLGKTFFSSAKENSLVPPAKPLLIDEEGNQVKRVFGPFFEGDIFILANGKQKQIICQFQENKSHSVVKWQEVIGRELELKLLWITLFSGYRNTKTLFVLDKKWRTDQGGDRGNNFPMAFSWSGLPFMFEFCWLKTLCFIIISTNVLS